MTTKYLGMCYIVEAQTVQQKNDRKKSGKLLQ